MFLIKFLFALLSKGNSKSITDEEAVAEYLKTQQSFYFDLIYERYSPKIYAKSISLLNDQYLAQDCTQEIMMKLLLNLNKFSNKSKFSTWVYSITYNYCIDKIRKRKKDPSINTDDFSYFDKEEEVDDQAIKEVRIDRLKVILEKIPTKDKTILLMKYMDNMSIRDISHITDSSESAVKMKIKRAKQKFIKLHDAKYMALEAV